MVASLRDEIAFFIAQQFIVALVITVVAVALYVLAHLERLAPVVRLIPIVVISGLFSLGRADLLMHRAGAYVMRMEPQVGGWESFKNSLAATRLLPLYDVFALTVWVYLFVWSERRVWDSRSNDRGLYVASTVLLAIIGVVSIAMGARAEL